MKLEMLDKLQVAASDTKVGHIYKLDGGNLHYLRISCTRDGAENTSFLCLGTNSAPEATRVNLPNTQRVIYVGEAKISLV
jgi:hypothetical protein